MGHRRDVLLESYGSKEKFSREEKSFQGDSRRTSPTKERNGGARTEQRERHSSPTSLSRSRQVPIRKCIPYKGRTRSCPCPWQRVLSCNATDLVEESLFIHAKTNSSCSLIDSAFGATLIWNQFSRRRIDITIRFESN